MTTQSYQTNDEYQVREEKLLELKRLGIDPYPNQFVPTHQSKKIQEKYQDATSGTSEEAQAGTTESVVLAGRLILFRSMGKNIFAHIQDSTGKIQVMFNRDATLLEGYTGQEPTPFKVIEKKFDLGDIIGVEGHLFHTMKGELTIFVKKATLLSKSLLPLADKHGGLHDKEIRYRKRWLDLISNDPVRDTFRKRSQILRSIRNFFENQGFIEVETPVLQSIYGGAEARPFTTELHALHQEMFLRISLEIPLKKLIVGGMDRVFEMGRVFRNEGIDRSHNPEFTLLEAYAAYWDYNDMMALFEKLVETLAIKLLGTTKIAAIHPETGEAVEIETKAPWPRFTMKESIKHFANIDPDALSDPELYKILEKSGHIDKDRLKLLSRGLMIAALFEIFVEPKLIQPHHITDHPIETTPLCKLHRDPKERKEGIVERFESFILAGEMCNAYTELNDPVLQRELLEKQASRRDAGDEEASPFDEEFVESICQGMPPTGGIGIGIDRLVMLLTHAHSIRDVLFFPWMKPLEP
jgi:lysyl-tRNA synthetase class 2